MNLIVAENPNDLYRRAASYIAEYMEFHPGAQVYFAPCKLLSEVSQLLPELSCVKPGGPIDLALVDADFTQPEVIKKARRVVVAASGQADEIYGAFCIPASEKHPLSALQEHAGLTVIIDRETAEALRAQI